ncbi:MAG: hypothetical protein V4691_10610, partial [Pseudomonadota bacterium]
MRFTPAFLDEIRNRLPVSAVVGRRGVVGYVPQKPDAEMSSPISVREMVVLGASWRVKGFARVSSEVRAYC